MKRVKLSEPQKASREQLAKVNAFRENQTTGAAVVVAPQNA